MRSSYNYRYQLWQIHKWGERNASPEETVYTIDIGLTRALELSKQKKTNKAGQSSPVIFLLDCSQNPSRIRGFAHEGKWRDAIEHCKSCENSSLYPADCKSCCGASWKHII